MSNVSNSLSFKNKKHNKTDLYLSRNQDQPLHTKISKSLKLLCDIMNSSYVNEDAVYALYNTKAHEITKELKNKTQDQLETEAKENINNQQNIIIPPRSRQLLTMMIQKLFEWNYIKVNVINSSIKEAALKKAEQQFYSKKYKTKPNNYYFVTNVHAPPLHRLSEDVRMIYNIISNALVTEESARAMFFAENMDNQVPEDRPVNTTREVFQYLKNGDFSKITLNGKDARAFGKVLDALVREEYLKAYLFNESVDKTVERLNLMVDLY